MRKTKFRVWDKKEKQMNQTDDQMLRQGRAVQFNLMIPWRENIFANEWELMQYTGCKDRNGKEIYEGDIVSYMEDLSNPKEVYFEKGVFWPLATFNTETAVTVLGNVFENSDLLNNNEE